MHRAYLSAVFVLLAVLPVMAADERPVSGTVELSESKFTLSHVVAYPLKYSDEPATAVIVSDRFFDVAKIKDGLAKSKNGTDEEVSLRQPHVKIVFDAEGKPLAYYGYASGFTTNGTGGKITAELKRDGDKISGSAKKEPDDQGRFRTNFDFKFSTGLIGTTTEAEQKAAPLAKLGVSGKFQGNGKEAKLAFISAYPREAFDDKPSLTIVMTEKDHSRDKKPDIKAGFGDYGSALVISCHEDGSIFSTTVAHAAHKRQGFSSAGSLNFTEFQIAGGQVQGRVKTDGEEEFFDDKWEVDLTLAAKYMAQKPAETKPTTAANKPAATATSDKPANARTPEKPTSDKPTTDKPMPTKPAAAGLKASDLVLPKDATDITYKKLVEHISCKSPTEYKAAARAYAKLLAEQGWKSDGSDLFGVSCILNRTRGDASLTIFVKPDGTGSTVSVITEGLDWGE
jgi:hypothetical protein